MNRELKRILTGYLVKIADTHETIHLAEFPKEILEKLPKAIQKNASDLDVYNIYGLKVEDNG